MRNGVTIEFPESEKAKFRAWTNQLTADNRRDCQTLVKSTAMNVHRRALSFVPVDKGLLKNSIRYTINNDGLGAEIYFTRKYAPYVEFGTGTGAAWFVPTLEPDLQAYAGTFRGRGIRKVNRRPQPYLFPALRLSQKEMIAKLNQMGFK